MASLSPKSRPGGRFGKSRLRPLCFDRFALKESIVFKMGKSTREAFGLALAEAGKKDASIVVVDGDVHNSTRTEHFAKLFPERFFNVGIAESDMVGVAAGLAASGKQAWVSSFAAFVMCNAYDQLRMAVAFPTMNVKVVGTHAGISIGEDGPSQMGIEDVSLACSCPLHGVPADESTMQAVQAQHDRPAESWRPNVPELHGEQAPFAIGRRLPFVKPGLTVPTESWWPAWRRLALAKEGKQARVLDIHRQPLDEAAVAATAEPADRRAEDTSWQDFVVRSP